MKFFRAQRYNLGRFEYDPAHLLEAWMALEQSGQGFVIEKNDDEGKASFVGVGPSETIRVLKGRAYRQFHNGRRRYLPGDPFKALGKQLSQYRVLGNALPFSTGMVGTMAYEMVRFLEKVPLKTRGEEACLMLYPAILVSREGKTELVALIPKGSAAGVARRRAEALAMRLSCLLPNFPAHKRSFGVSRDVRFSGVMGRSRFLRGVRKLKEHIGAGDIFQGVISERFSAPLSVPSLAVYDALKSLGPAPYLFYMRDGGRHFLGASPERLVKVVDGQALNCPIAGTRPRGKTSAEDKRHEKILKADPKEQAEHLMLVDLARNDLGRVCVPGTVKVRELMKLKRFPNVMHLVSQVQGKLERGVSSWDALAASFPAGTVSGAPKVRAMQLITKLEPRARGFYAGAVLQHDFRGNLDSCIAIRSALIEKGRIDIQAGAGIVADSKPEKEYQEALHKLSGLRRAVSLAEGAA